MHCNTKEIRPQKSDFSLTDSCGTLSVFVVGSSSSAKVCKQSDFHCNLAVVKCYSVWAQPGKNRGGGGLGGVCGTLRTTDTCSTPHPASTNLTLTDYVQHHWSLLVDALHTDCTGQIHWAIMCDSRYQSKVTWNDGHLFISTSCSLFQE